MTITDEKQISREITPRFSDQPLKISRERFHEMVSWFAAQPDVAPKLATAAKAVSWLLEVDAFREMEEVMMDDGTYEATLTDHRAFLSELIADGENLVWTIKRVGMAADKLRFTLADVQATLDSLNTAFRCEHGPKNSQKTNELIGKLFDGSQS